MFGIGSSERRQARKAYNAVGGTGRDNEKLDALFRDPKSPLHAVKTFDERLDVLSRYPWYPSWHIKYYVLANDIQDKRVRQLVESADELLSPETRNIPELCRLLSGKPDLPELLPRNPAMKRLLNGDVGRSGLGIYKLSSRIAIADGVRALVKSWDLTSHSATIESALKVFVGGFEVPGMLARIGAVQTADEQIDLRAFRALANDVLALAHDLCAAPDPSAEVNLSQVLNAFDQKVGETPFFSEDGAIERVRVQAAELQNTTGILSRKSSQLELE